MQFLLEYGVRPEVFPNTYDTGFELVGAFRDGFLQGGKACDVGNIERPRPGSRPSLRTVGRRGPQNRASGELPAGGADARVVVADDAEQLDQVLAGLVAVLAGGAPDDVEQPVEGRLDVAGAEQEVGGPGLRGDVVRRGVGGLASASGPASSARRNSCTCASASAASGWSGSSARIAW